MPTKSSDEKIAKARTVYRLLKKRHSDAHCELNFKTPLDLLVATVLSAQCTDKRVNEVTKELFKHCRSAKDYVALPQAKLESIIRSTGFFRQKAKSIKGAAQALTERHGGKVPQTMEELTKLPGVGRKTANVILGNAFGIPGMPVDTHVIRLSNRIGLAEGEDAVKIEAALTALIPKKEWTHFSHVMIFHGRRVCGARKPDCEKCPVNELCNYYLKQ